MLPAALQCKFPFGKVENTFLDFFFYMNIVVPFWLSIQYIKVFVVDLDKRVYNVEPGRLRWNHDARTAVQSLLDSGYYTS